MINLFKTTEDGISVYLGTFMFVDLAEDAGLMFQKKYYSKYPPNEWKDGVLPLGRQRNEELTISTCELNRKCF